MASTTVYKNNTTTSNTQFIQKFIVHILTTEILVLGSGDVTGDHLVTAQTCRHDT
jgi:hypothetical protein